MPNETTRNTPLLDEMSRRAKKVLQMMRRQAREPAPNMLDMCSMIRDAAKTSLVDAEHIMNALDENPEDWPRRFLDAARGWLRGGKEHFVENIELSIKALEDQSQQDRAKRRTRAQIVKETTEKKFVTRAAHESNDSDERCD